jgi:hypothetical protein
MASLPRERRPRRIEARFFTEAGQVDEGTFWEEVERLAGAGARAQIGEREVRWKLTPKGETMARLIREQSAAGA